MDMILDQDIKKCELGSGNIVNPIQKKIYFMKFEYLEST